MSPPLKPADALALAVRLLAGHGFAQTARNTRGDSVYLKPEGCAFALRVSNHARTPKQRRNHPDAVTSLVIRQPKTAAQVEELVEASVRNFWGQLKAREEETG